MDINIHAETTKLVLVLEMSHQINKHSIIISENTIISLITITCINRLAKPSQACISEFHWPSAPLEQRLQQQGRLTVDSSWQPPWWQQEEEFSNRPVLNGRIAIATQRAASMRKAEIAEPISFYCFLQTNSQYYNGWKGLIVDHIRTLARLYL